LEGVIILAPRKEKTHRERENPQGERKPTKREKTHKGDRKPTKETENPQRRQKIHKGERKPTRKKKIHKERENLLGERKPTGYCLSLDEIYRSRALDDLCNLQVSPLITEEQIGYKKILNQV